MGDLAPYLPPGSASTGFFLPGVIIMAKKQTPMPKGKGGKGKGGKKGC